MFYNKKIAANVDHEAAFAIALKGAQPRSLKHPTDSVAGARRDSLM
ncbi:hypothetical protein [Paraburkholderia oxyphila]|nr:hypothetical protein [Paraburkholderia oxyphila]